MVVYTFNLSTQYSSHICELKASYDCMRKAYLQKNKKANKTVLVKVFERDLHCLSETVSAV